MRRLACRGWLAHDDPGSRPLLDTSQVRSDRVLRVQREGTMARGQGTVPPGPQLPCNRTERHDRMLIVQFGALYLF